MIQREGERWGLVRHVSRYIQLAPLALQVVLLMLVVLVAIVIVVVVVVLGVVVVVPSIGTGLINLAILIRA